MRWHHSILNGLLNSKIPGWRHDEPLSSLQMFFVTYQSKMRSWVCSCKIRAVKMKPDVLVTFPITLSAITADGITWMKYMRIDWTEIPFMFTFQPSLRCTLELEFSDRLAAISAAGFTPMLGAVIFCSTSNNAHYTWGQFSPPFSSSTGQLNRTKAIHILVEEIGPYCDKCMSRLNTHFIETIRINRIEK